MNDFSAPLFKEPHYAVTEKHEEQQVTRCVCGKSWPCPTTISTPASRQWPPAGLETKDEGKSLKRARR